MPDVKLFDAGGVLPAADSPETRELAGHLRAAVAEEMSCYVADGESITTQEQVDLLIFRTGTGMEIYSDGAALILEVSAFPYEDRMDSIDERMKAIAAALNEGLQAAGRGPVDITYTFIRTEKGLWGKLTPPD